MPRNSKQICIKRICQTCKTEFLFYTCPSFIERGYGKYCSLECYHRSRIVPFEDKFFSYVGDIDRSTGCILWIGTTNKDGYGIISTETRKGKTLLAHRASYELMIGSITNSLHVLHKCDNPPCINPSHLFLGTQEINMKDMATKKRGRKRVPGSRRYLKENC